MLQNGYNPNAEVNDYNKTALIAVASEFTPTEIHVEITKLLLVYKADPNKSTKRRPYFHQMCYSVRNQHAEAIIKLLFDHNLDLHFDEDEKRLHLLTCASMGGLYWLVLHLLENGNKLDLNKDNPIRNAVQSRQNGVKIVKLLLKYGITLEESNTNPPGSMHSGESLLYLAMSSGIPDIVEFLLEQQFDPLEGNEFAIFGTVNDGPVNTFETLIKKGGPYVKPNYSKIVLHERLVDRMCRFPDQESIQICLQKFDVLHKNGYSFKDLLPAEDSKSVTNRILYFIGKRAKIPKYLSQAIIHLLRLELNPMQIEWKYQENTDKGSYRQTLFHLAAQINSQELLKTCIELYPNISINIMDKEGWTPLHYAAMHKNGKWIKLLLEHNAVIDIKSTKEKKIKKTNYKRNTSVLNLAKEFNTEKFFK